MIGVVQELGASQNGKPKVKISGQWYFLGRTVAPQLGQQIDFTSSTFGDKNQLKGLQEWKPAVTAQNSARPQTQSQAPLPVVQALGIDSDELRYVSNCVGQAIAAKTIIAPSQIAAWVYAARNALKMDSELGNEEPPPGTHFGEEPPAFDDEIPF